jgi:hypothetical protein
LARWQRNDRRRDRRNIRSQNRLWEEPSTGKHLLRPDSRFAELEREGKVTISAPEKPAKPEKPRLPGPGRGHCTIPQVEIDASVKPPTALQIKCGRYPDGRMPEVPFSDLIANAIRELGLEDKFIIVPSEHVTTNRN